MDKIKVNNQVVSMRKFVKQAKIHAINKCTKQIKFLENRKGNEEQMAKTKRKHQRLLEEVSLLKKIKPDSVSKLALTKAKDWKAVLSQKNVPLEDKCFAMLANHIPVQEAVEKFHRDNSELIAKIPELVRQWEGKKSRSSQIYKKKQKGNVDNPNTLSIGNKHNFHKSSEAHVRCRSSVPLERLNSSDLKSLHNDITEENLAIDETTKRKQSLDILDLKSGPTKNKLSVTDGKKNDAADDSLSNGSDFASNESIQIKDKLQVENKSKSGQSYKSLKQYDACNVQNQTSLSEKKGILIMEAVDCADKNEIKVMSNEEEQSAKSQDIRCKLLEISMSKTKVQNKPKHKTSAGYYQSNEETDSDNGTTSDAIYKLHTSTNVNSGKANPAFSSKPEAKSKMKAVTMLDLNQLQNVDEIPIEKADSDAEVETDESSGKQKKDPFFLCNGEPVSESDEDENAKKETVRKRDFSPFKNKPYNNFREHKGNSFQKGKFEKHSVNGRNLIFRENSFKKNRNGFSFKDSKRNFKPTFGDGSDYQQNKNFKSAAKDKFNNRNGTKNSKEKPFSKNHTRDTKRNSYLSKPNISNSSRKNIDDDKPLHPSWEAKRKLKEAANIKFQGKRMVFKD